MIKENDIISKVLITISQYKNASSFKHAITEGEYCPSKSKNFTRSLIWKTCLITETLKIKEWDTKLGDSRVIYHKLSQNSDMITPWWLLEKDSGYYQTREMTRKASVSRKASTHRKTKPSSAKKSLVRVNNVADPLGGNGGSVSNSSLVSDASSPTPSSSEPSIDAHEQDLELLESIIMDIDRIFPGDDFFHSNSPQATTVKRELIQILYVWSKCNPQVGYKQGIHEILGLIYINLYHESVLIPSTNTMSADDLQILSLYDIRYLSHDMFTIFNRFMIQTDIASRFYESEASLWNSIEDFNVNLMKVDQLIHYNLVTKLKLESQLWIIRYLRLLLLRELGSDNSITIGLWDRLVAVEVNINNGPSSLIPSLKPPDSTSTSNSLKAIPDLIMFMVIILLIHIKTELVTCDFSESLSLLLHYPMKEKLESPTVGPHFIDNLFLYALKLYEKKNQDLKLYEFGRKLNQKFNPNLKITMSYNGTSTTSRTSDDLMSSSRSPSLSPAPTSSSAHSNGSTNNRAEKMAFEKMRLEMRLKKRAQSLIRP